MSSEDTTCPVCGYSGSRWLVSKFVEGRLFNIRQCKVCDHGYINPMPTIDLISRLASDYGLGTDNTIINEGVMNHLNHLFQNYINRNFSAQGKLLAVTNEEGSIENVARKHNWDTTTLPFKDLMFLLSNLNLERGTEAEILPDFYGKFDLIFLNHVFEHFLDPVKAMIILTPWLKTDGCMLIVVPNIGSDEAKMEGHKWKYVNIPFHINYFNELSLKSFFSKKLTEHGMHFVNLFNTTFPQRGQKEGEAITSLYRIT